MADLLWYFPEAQFPEAVYEWQRMANELVYRGTGPRLTLWPFEGPQPLAGGLAALFGEFFRWRGPAYKRLTTRFEYGENGEVSWNSDMLRISPSTYSPVFVAGSAKVWGELSDEKLTLNYQHDQDSQTWTLTGNTIEIVQQLFGVVPQVLARVGIRTADWQPEEALDVEDASALQTLLASWGELNIRYELIDAGLEEYSDALGGAIRRMLSSATIGSRFACWVAVHALLPIAANLYTSRQEDAENALVGLASVYPRCAWPSLALGLLEWDRGNYQHAAELFETAVEADPRVVTSWQMLSILYDEMYEFEKAERVCEEAISGNIADPTLYYRLGSLLLDHAGDDPDADEARVRRALAVFAEAEDRGLVDPVLMLRVMDACEALGDDDNLWAAFDRLLEYDQEGMTIWQVAEDADSYEDFSAGIERLQHAAEARQSYSLYAALVRALVRLDRREDATTLLPILREVANDAYEKAETAQLSLEVDDPDFEDTFGQIAADVEDGIIPDATMTEYLTGTLQKEPLFADGAALLAQALQARDEYEEAQTILSETLKQLPDHLELTLELADLYWAQDQDSEAESLLLTALAANPEDVALLARLAEYYFEIGDDEKAREFLERADVLDPFNPELMRVQAHIAEQLDDGTDDEQ